MQIIAHEIVTSEIDFGRLGLRYKEHELGNRAKFVRFIAKRLGVPIPDYLPNALLDEGEKNVLDVYFRNTNVPAQFYLGLGNNGGTPATPADTTLLSGVTEVSGTGYARQLVNRNTTDWGASALDAGDYQSISKTVLFENTGGSSWTAADYWFLTTVLSGTSGLLLCAGALSSSRVVAAGQGFNLSIKQKGK